MKRLKKGLQDSAAETVEKASSNLFSSSEDETSPLEDIENKPPPPPRKKSRRDRAKRDSPEPTKGSPVAELQFWNAAFQNNSIDELSTPISNPHATETALSDSENETRSPTADQDTPTHAAWEDLISEHAHGAKGHSSRKKRTMKEAVSSTQEGGSCKHFQFSSSWTDSDTELYESETAAQERLTYAQRRQKHYEDIEQQVAARHQEALQHKTLKQAESLLIALQHLSGFHPSWTTEPTSGQRDSGESKLRLPKVALPLEIQRDMRYPHRPLQPVEVQQKLAARLKLRWSHLTSFARRFVKHEGLLDTFSGRSDEPRQRLFNQLNRQWVKKTSVESNCDPPYGIDRAKAHAKLREAFPEAYEQFQQVIECSQSDLEKSAQFALQLNPKFSKYIDPKLIRQAFSAPPLNKASSASLKLAESQSSLFPAKVCSKKIESLANEPQVKQLGVVIPPTPRLQTTQSRQTRLCWVSKAKLTPQKLSSSLSVGSDVAPPPTEKSDAQVTRESEDCLDSSTSEFRSNLERADGQVMLNASQDTSLGMQAAPVPSPSKVLQAQKSHPIDALDLHDINQVLTTSTSKDDISINEELPTPPSRQNASSVDIPPEAYIPEFFKSTKPTNHRLIDSVALEGSNDEGDAARLDSESTSTSDEEDDAEKKELFESLIGQVSSEQATWDGSLMEYHRELMEKKADDIYQRKFTYRGLDKSHDQTLLTRRQVERQNEADLEDAQRLLEASEVDAIIAEYRRKCLDQETSSSDVTSSSSDADADHQNVRPPRRPRPNRSSKNKAGPNVSMLEDGFGLESMEVPSCSSVVEQFQHPAFAYKESSLPAAQFLLQVKPPERSLLCNKAPSTDAVPMYELLKLGRPPSDQHACDV